MYDDDMGHGGAHGESPRTAKAKDMTGEAGHLLAAGTKGFRGDEYPEGMGPGTPTHG